jgi:hypothetical protein
MRFRQLLTFWISIHYAIALKERITPVKKGMTSGNAFEAN